MKKSIISFLIVVLSFVTGEPSYAEYKALSETHFAKKPTFADVVVDTVRTDLTKVGSVRDLRMNIYRPEGIHGTVPAIIYVHGGAWNSGDYTCASLMEKDTSTNDPFFACMRALNMGCAVVTADYRLSTEALFPAMLWDLKGQIRFLRANAQKYKIDPDRIIVWGQSAGAHLCNLLGTTHGVDELEGSVGGNLEHSSRPTAVVDYYGMTDLLDLAPDQYERPYIIDPRDMYEQADAPSSSRAQVLGFNGKGEGLDVLRAHLGNPGTPYENPASPYQEALHRAYLSCPLNFVDKSDCPFMILYGGRDHGSPLQVCMAAEIAMEHCLGMTCDPIAGLVQVPCIERNAIAAVKAINAARMALRRTSPPRITLDEVIESMYQTGKDMNVKYRETSTGGLARAVRCE